MKAIELSESAGLQGLTASLRNSKVLCLKAFFLAKTHKEGTPFQVIVSEAGSWQRCLGSFLLKCLKILAVKDPYLVHKASEVSDFLARSCPAGMQVFSVDIKDLFYSMPPEDLVRVVKK